jgi:peptidoglycan-associated lipoprotein
MNTRRTAAWLACALCACALGSCGGEKKAAAPPSAPTASGNAKIKRASGAVGVSDDLARACKLQLAEKDNTPKFDYDRSELTKADRDVLQKVAECLTTGPLHGRSLQLIGRADARGESQYNMVLGANRASGVAECLAQLGLERGRLSLTSRGELDATGADENGYREDRRVDILLAQ